MNMKETVLNGFAEVFGNAEGAKVFFAPGRVNMIGEHTDYNGGHVFPCALTIGTYGVARKREDNKLRFYSMNFEKLGIIESSLEDLVSNKEDGWTNYPKGVMWAFGEKGMKVPCGRDILLNGNIPNGSGLSAWLPCDKKQNKALILGEGPIRMEKPNMLKLVKTMLTNKAVGE